MLIYREESQRSIRSRLLSSALRVTLKPLLTRGEYDPIRSRDQMQRHMRKRRCSPGVRIEAPKQAGLCGEWQIPAGGSAGACILYLHGGGYMLGSPRLYRSLTTRLAALAGCPLFSLDYRLAPEHPFPAAVDDALGTYLTLLDTGVNPQRLTVVGDSAGGGLALALIHALKERKQPLPAAAAVYSPFADLKATGKSLRENSDSCAMFDQAAIPKAASFYLQGADANSPLASPLYGDFSGFPPLWISVSASEIIRDDALRIAEKAHEAGVAVSLNVWQGQPHAWPAFYPLLPEADQCLAEVARLAKSPGAALVSPSSVSGI